MMGILLLLATVAAPAAADEEFVGRVRVLSGEVLVIGGIPVRLFGIDALEIDQTCSNGLVDNYPCGRFAAGRLGMMLTRQEVRCVVEGELSRTESGQALPLGRCYMRDMDIAEWVVRSGYAMADRDQSDAYVKAEDHAREAETGIWAGPFVTPAEWRDGKR